MNQLTTYNHFNDEKTNPRRYAGFPLNSTLVSFFTPDTIRSIITHAVSGKPYTTAVWIRLSRIGIQISAQDPQIARTRIPVFIPLSLVHDIFVQNSINNVICIVYDEVKTNMKGVLLYVVHPGDAHLIREDFRLIKKSFYSKGISTPNINEGKLNRHVSPRRILYIRDSETGANKESSPTSGLPQLAYTPLKNGSQTHRDDSSHRRHRSPKKSRGEQSSSKPASEDGRQSHVGRSPALSETLVEKNVSDEPVQEIDEQRQQQIATWQAAQVAPIIPLGIYNRYVPKAVPLPTGETIMTTLPSSPTNGAFVAHIEQAPLNSRESRRSPSRSRSISSKRHDQHHHQQQQQQNPQPSQHRNRSSSAQNGEASGKLIQSAHHHHHRHHHHSNGPSQGSSKGESQKYGTISHSIRKRPAYLPMADGHEMNHTSPDPAEDMRQYLKQLIDDMQAIKLEMTQIRQSSTSRARADTLHVNLKEIRHDIDAIRARMSMTPKLAQK